MDLRILPTLRCPITSTPLDVQIIASEKYEGRTLVRTGVLYSEQSKHWYPIINYVPVLLTFETRLATRFRLEHAAAFAALNAYHAPAEPPMAGEVSVQKTFTEEWSGLGNDERTFAYSDAELVALHRDVWLQFSPAELAAVDTVLNIGCGFGKEACILGDIFPNADVFGSRPEPFALRGSAPTQ